MREAALRKRRQQAEELLQWNQKLLEEEKRINELELKASSIIRQQPIPESKHGKQLNNLWYNVTGHEENKFTENKKYRMSQIALERFCKSGRDHSSKKTKKLLSISSNSEYSVADISVSDKVTKPKTSQSSSVHSETKQQQLEEKSANNVSLKDYTSDFDVDTTGVEDGNVNENIDELIHDFSRIEDDISSLSSKHSHTSHVGLTTEGIRISESPKSNRTDSDAEISVIETNRIPKDTTTSTQIKTTSADDECSKNEFKPDVATETHDNLNESKEILLILGGESEPNIPQNNFEISRVFDELTAAENINTSEEILSTLNEIVDIVSGDNISKDCALIENLNTSENILTTVPDQVESIQNLLLLETNRELSMKENDALTENRIEMVVSTNEYLDGENEEEKLDVQKCMVENNDDVPSESCGDTDIDEVLSTDLDSVKKTDDQLASVDKCCLELSKSAIQNESQSRLDLIEDGSFRDLIETGKERFFLNSN